MVEVHRVKSSPVIGCSSFRDTDIPVRTDIQTDMCKAILVCPSFFEGDHKNVNA